MLRVRALKDHEGQTAELTHAAISVKAEPYFVGLHPGGP